MSNDTGTGIVVRVVQLVKEDGTRYSVNGIEVDEGKLSFGSEDRTIESLKVKINELYFAMANRPLGRIRVYRYDVLPDSAALGAGSWVPCKLSDSIEAGILYGFIDLTMEQSDERAAQKRRLDDLLFYHRAVIERGTSKSSKLLKVRRTRNQSKRCFLCTAQQTAKLKIEAARVFRKQDIYATGGEENLHSLDLLKDWASGWKWNRRFEIHESNESDLALPHAQHSF